MTYTAVMKTLCIYCGASAGLNPIYMQAATALGKAMLKRDLRLVYGGASVGLMGQIAETVLAGGGEVIGVMPQALIDKEVSHPGLTKLHVVSSMHERKALMAELSDGFLAMPGGYGTLEELFEALTWAQLGYHDKPCALLNINGYYDGLIAFMRHATDEAFVKPIHRDMLLTSEHIDELLDSLENYTAPQVTKWITSEQT